MILELLPYSQKTLEANKKSSLTKSIEFYDKNEQRANTEKLLLEMSFKEALKRNTKLYKVKDKSQTTKDTLAYFSISVGNINVNKKKIPSAVVDYFIINNKYRKYKIKPNNYTLAIELFREVLTLIYNLSQQIAIRYIILEPLAKEPELIKFYEKFGFKFIPSKDTTWMYLDIKELS